MKRRMLIMLASVILTACGGGTETKQTTAPPVEATPAVAQTQPFSQTVELHGISFKVESPNSATGNKVTITPAGLQVSNESVTVDANGEVIGAEIGDLNIDQSPEVYVYVRGADKRASLIAYGTNSKKSMSQIYLPELDPQSKEAAGFNGEDEFAVVESTLVHRFPIFEAGQKTGKMRQFQLKLKPGEAGWVLKTDKVVEY